jgi:hypothetical protein
MKLESLLPCSQKPAIWAYPELNESSPLLPLYFNVLFNIILRFRPDFPAWNSRTRSMKCYHYTANFGCIIWCRCWYFWLLTPCGFLATYKRFGGTFCLHLRGRKRGSMFLRNVGTYLLLPCRPTSISSPPWEPQISHNPLFTCNTQPCNWSATECMVLNGRLFKKHTLNWN